MPCPLCQHSSTQLLSTPDKRYYKCPRCWLIYMDQEYYPNPKDEKKRYLEHNNDITNQGYIDFLNRIINTALPHLNRKMNMLDYGSGPNPVLSQLLEKQGFLCDDYDPFFCKVPLTKQYDSIFYVETMEHFFEPQKEIERLSSLLSSGGFLFVMTLLWTDIERFARWFYRRDLTHVCFYHARTFDYIANQYDFDLKYIDGKRVIVMQKNG